MKVMFQSYDDHRIEPASGSGLCNLCDQPVEASDIGLATIRYGGMDIVYLCHASCLMEEDEDE